MTAAARRPSPLRRAFAAALLLAASFGAASCKFLSDEFTWLDTAGPVAEGAPDRPVPALDDRR